MAIRILTDSACDIMQDEAKRLGIDILPLHTTFGGTEYRDGYDLTHDEFFEKLIESDVLPTTSQIAPYEYEQAFETVRAAGDTAVCITLSSKLSGCCQSARIAAADYADCIRVVDSKNASLGQQILIRYAVSLRDAGKTADEIADALEEKKNSLRLIALLDTLEYLKKGGRISSAAAIAGTLLSIKPVIALEDGAVVMLGKARGSKNGNNMLSKLIQQSGGVDFSMPYTLAYSGLSDHLLRKYIADSEALWRGQTETLPVTTIGSAIGTHIGPGAIGAAFFVRTEG